MNRKMVALVIGNGAYNDNNALLVNPKNDAEDVTSALEKLDFSVICKTDCTSEEIDRAAKTFKESLNSNDVGLFYFAGHGMQIEGENFITAIDTDFSEEFSAKWSSFPLNKLIDLMEGCSNKTNIIILDACRNNPYVRAWNRDVAVRGLAPIFAPKGTIIAYSTSPGETASDGSGQNGAYTEALLKHLNKTDTPIENVFKRVRNSLSLITKGKQTSWEHTSLMGDFFFNLSLGNRIDKYSKSAISDELFALDEKLPLHEIISKLKVHDWYIQNPSIRAVTSNDLKESDKDTLFVLGRNIYQAACGSSDGSSDFINNFRTKTQGVDKDKVENILEGMLFEIFFSSKGDIRNSFKLSRFNAVFELQKHDDLAPSFEFISECLLPFQNRFYVIPGKPINDVTVAVTTEKNSVGEYKVTGVYYEGDDVIQVDPSAHVFSDEVFYEPMRYNAFLSMLSEDMIIPRNFLSIDIDASLSGSSKVLFPYGHTLNRT
ncbi:MULTISPECIES: caspase family protein [unclassified Colwellia]|uniref:caspase family protein n=1 Tax=unclassified Colwellia TaxID=196834 RepID=UPI0015F76585|nr:MULTISPECIES: caspase family protein [unclassified Colwellia]MBA6379296.1 caspase family protein [Colwellia sp. BRX10-7]MBA6387092.1 caspase family protein [Colwellia sp. BRX10-2]MBA6401828.1 caspase family protein [Colwellia sp. BRX10-5]MBA6405738.1 caspase family protein [Colwellia sp. BRX10-1]